MHNEQFPHKVEVAENVAKCSFIHSYLKRLFSYLSGGQPEVLWRDPNLGDKAANCATNAFL